MGTLCSIFHSRFKHLISIIPSTRKAQLLDYILLGWQTSTYRLKDSNKKWFMKPYSEIIVDTGIPKSTLERYIKELADEGFIIRRHALYNRLNENNHYTVKKGTYIQITDKLLILLNHTKESVDNKHTLTEEQPDKHSHEVQSIESTLVESLSQCSDFTKNEGTNSLKMREPIIRDLYTSLSNIIIQKKLLKNVDNQQVNSFIHQFETMQAFLKDKIQEEIPESMKKKVLGTFFNLCFEHQVLLSDPKQVTAEYLYALINLEFYLPKVQDLHHRNNILAKLLRNKIWKTPKGFYKYFYLSHEFQSNAEWEKDIHKDKLVRELEGIECPIMRGEIQARFENIARVEAKYLKSSHAETMPREICELKTQLREINAEIYYQGTYLSELELLQNDKAVHADTIAAIKGSLEKLYKEQAEVENKLEHLAKDTYALCA